MSSHVRSVVIHGHFYQPPREDPWFEEVGRQPSAAPFHDWNERIEKECYRAVLAARVPGPGGRIQAIVNTLRYLSFNLGPTLLEWLEAEAEDTYRGILAADEASGRDHGGHGNALAQAFHHTILPLASRREKVTEVRWGMADFRRRFRREPAGMWLPETAVDAETLDVLAQEGIAFTILAPHQVKGAPRDGGPGLYRTSGGRSIALFPYHGPLSHGIAFGSLLRDAGAWAEAVANAEYPKAPEEAAGSPSPGSTSQDRAEAGDDAPDPEPQGRRGSGATTGAGKRDDPGRVPAHLVAMATDGETYGHHHPFGEMALAAVIRLLRTRPDVRVENFASYLARNPPTVEVELAEPSSWSCSHGVERWRAACGCAMEPEAGTQQEWRRPLRKAMDDLARDIHILYEEEAPPLLGSPWEARDAYGAVVTQDRDALRTFVEERAARALEPPEVLRALELLELERNALRLFTSCAWFFDDLARIEPLQVLRYAARALELAGPRGEAMERAFLERLARAVSNEDPPRDGRTLFLQEVKPEIPAPFRVAAGAAACRAANVRGRAPRGYAVKLNQVEGDGGQTGQGEGARRMSESGIEEGPILSFLVRHRRTGRSWTLETWVERAGSVRTRVSVWPHGDPQRAVPVVLAHLPESYRTSLEEAVRWEVLERRATPELIEKLRRGAMTREEVASRALDAAVRALEEETLGGPADLPSASATLETPPTGPTPQSEGTGPGKPGAVRGPTSETLERVADLAELLHLLDRPIPFHAQTRFWRVLTGSPPEVASALSALREPLGFVPAS